MDLKPNKQRSRVLPAILLVSLLLSRKVHSQTTWQSAPRVDIAKTLSALLLEEDTDGDRKITVEDSRVGGTPRGDKVFWLTSTAGQRLEIAGTPYLSNLLQELKLAMDQGLSETALDSRKVFELPADRISRMIRELYWDELTRSIDENGLQDILGDTKISGSRGLQYLYVPASDRTAVSYFRRIADRFPKWKLEIIELPANRSPAFMRELAGRHGLLSLGLVVRDSTVSGVPFVVPGGRFNEMYGWDSYFIVLGLLHDGKVSLAKSMVDNFVYEIRQYGAILNANRTYYLTRSQPPFLTSMIRAVLPYLPDNPESKRWLEGALEAAMGEYENVWMNTDRLTSTRLSRYFDSGEGPAPEVAEYGPVYEHYAKRHQLDARELERRYKSGTIVDSELDAYFVHDRAMRESGHDTSYRLVNRCANLITIDLNSLLYKIEKDFEEILRTSFGGSLSLRDRVMTAEEWGKRAESRKDAVDRFLWDDQAGLYFDYDVAKNQRTGYVSATTLYPLWAGLASRAQAESLVREAIPLLEMPGGIAGSTVESRGPITPGRPERQWDYPFGWSPHQILAWDGLQRYGYGRIARRLAYRWLYTITVNAAHYNGTVPEKYDVVERTHKVFAEYGNVGTTFSYITREGFGWTNASFQIGLDLLTTELRESLNRLVPPEWIPGLQ